VEAREVPHKGGRTFGYRFRPDPRVTVAAEGQVIDL
jgi:hypothetical protein